MVLSDITKKINNGSNTNRQIIKESANSQLNIPRTDSGNSSQDELIDDLPIKMESVASCINIQNKSSKNLYVRSKI